MLFNMFLYFLYLLSTKIYFCCLINFRVYYFSVRIFQINHIIFIRRENNKVKKIILKEPEEMLTLLIHPFQQFIKTRVSHVFSEYRQGQCSHKKVAQWLFRGRLVFPNTFLLHFKSISPSDPVVKSSTLWSSGTPSPGHLRHHGIVVIFHIISFFFFFLKNTVWAHN